MGQRLLAVFLLLATEVVCAQRLLTTPDFSSFAARPLGSVEIRQLLPLADGGQLVVGDFEVWYEGKQFVDLLRLKPDGEPDTQWQVLANGRIDSVVSSSLGTVLSGAFTYVNGAPVASPVLLSSLGLGMVSLTQIPDAHRVYGASLDGSTGFAYVVALMNDDSYQARRINARTGLLDAQWRIQLSKTYGSPTGGTYVDSRGGLWISWIADTCFVSCPTVKIARFSIADPGREFVAGLAASWQRLPVFTDDFAYLDTYRYRIDTGVRDTAWKTSDPIATTDNSFAYYLSFDEGSQNPALPAGVAFRRASLAETGAYDTWIFRTLALQSSSAGTSYGYGPVVRWALPGGYDDIVAVVTERRPGHLASPALMVRDVLAAEKDVAVVEYYVPTLKHYFMTGREKEQAALDALPQTFQRTGMKFTAKSSRYRDIPEQPVCRMYAAPEKGGSNSHFYGIGSDCATLNKLSGLKYEGFDFSALKPEGTACSVDAPNPVWRLFNNRAATNDGNHRYVVSAATRARMVAQGWVDEGVVFCSASVTDASN